MTATALTSTTVSAPRPVPWRRLGWVAWRRYRPFLAATGALLGVVALYLLVKGHQMRDAYDAVQACTPKSSADCRFASLNFHDDYGDFGFRAGILVFLPAVIGAFAGAPLLAREFETRTFQFAWTQGVGRMRWLLSLVVPGVLLVAVVNAALGLLITWYNEPLVESGIQQRLHGSLFPLTGIAIVAWGLLAYSLGVVSGLLIRHVVPALAATLAGWTALALLASNLRGRHYESPLATARLQLAPGDLPIQQWWSRGGVRVSEAQVNHVLHAIGVQSTNGGGDFVVGPGGGSVDPVQYLLHHGYAQWTSYQPDSRYWTFQAIEAGWLILLCAILMATTLWLVRRRGA